MPTIPPPPPMNVISNARDLKSSIDRNNNLNKIEISECKWAINVEPEIQRACFFARTCEYTSPKECVYMKVDSILQTGEIIHQIFISLKKYLLVKQGDCYLHNHLNHSAKLKLDSHYRHFHFLFANKVVRLKY